jgi:hypothetical protein
VFPADFLYSKIKGNRSNFLAQIQSNNLETKSDSSFLR